MQHSKPSDKYYGAGNAYIDGGGGGGAKQAAGRRTPDHSNKYEQTNKAYGTPYNRRERKGYQDSQRRNDHTDRQNPIATNK